MFTALHRALGLQPGPITDDLLHAAVAGQVEETDDLDWKSELPPTTDLKNSDFPKDIAAMANSGGGVIVYGVTESQKKATDRKDTGQLTENHARSLRQVAISAISPPIFGLNIIPLGSEGSRAVAIVIPSSVDGPHLIYRGEYFGAPVRNNADTVWMREREIASQYRARFDAARHATEVLDTMYANAIAGRDTAERAWLIAVAHPRAAGPTIRWTRDQARELFNQAMILTESFARIDGIHPLTAVSGISLHPGLRCWIAPNKTAGETARRFAASVSIHFDGSVALMTSVGEHRRIPGNPAEGDPFHEGWRIGEHIVEATVADLMALIRVVGRAVGAVEYETRVGIEWAGQEPLAFYRNIDGFDETGSEVPVHRFVPVETTVGVWDDDDGYLGQVRELASDCVNQGGVMHLYLIKQDPDAAGK